MNYGLNFVFSIVIVCYLFSACVQIVTADSSSCESAVERYLECKHLKKRVSESGEIEIDWLAPGNSLNSSFLNATLANIGLEEAIDMQREIYLASSNYSNCSSFLCRCMGGIEDEFIRDTRFAFAFSDENVYAQFKRILLDYANEYGMKNLTWLQKFLMRRSTPLENFCSRYDFFSSQGKLFNLFNIPPCLNQSTIDPWTTILQKLKEIDGCVFPHLDELKYRNYIFRKDNTIDSKLKSVEETVAVCTGKSMGLDKACTRVERRLMMVSVFSLAFRNLWYGEADLTGFIDSLTDRMAAKEIFTRNTSALIDDSRIFTIKTLNHSFELKYVFKNQNMSLFSSPMFNITANVQAVFSKKSLLSSLEYFRRIKSITISSMFDLSTPQYVFNRTFDLYSLAELSSDNFIQNPLDETEKTWIRWINVKPKLMWIMSQRRYFKFFDFRWNVSIGVDNSFFKIVMPESLTSQASGGILLEGLSSSSDEDSD